MEGNGGRAEASSDCADVFESAECVRCGWWVDMRGQGLGDEVQKARWAHMVCGELEFWPITGVIPNGRWSRLSGLRQPSYRQIMEERNGVEGGVQAESYGHSPSERK